MSEQTILTEVGDVWYDDRIASIPTGDTVTDAAYRMERASRDYSLPQSITTGGSK